MDLNSYFQEPGAPSMVEFARRCDCNSDQIRQWRHAYDDRQPGAQMCVVIEVMSERKVRRWDLRPRDWHLIWPELVGTEGAPPIPTAQAA